MVYELIMQERLSGLQRVIRSGQYELAYQLIEAMKDEIDLKRVDFEKEFAPPAAL